MATSRSRSANSASTSSVSGRFGFGGPIALVGYMQRDLVERRGWISEQDYREGLALAQLAPGPLAAQLAIYLGWVRARVLGATLVAFAFVLPSFLMVLAISALYVRFGQLELDARGVLRHRRRRHRHHHPERHQADPGDPGSQPAPVGDFRRQRRDHRHDRVGNPLELSPQRHRGDAHPGTAAVETRGDPGVGRRPAGLALQRPPRSRLAEHPVDHRPVLRRGGCLRLRQRPGDRPVPPRRGRGALSDG